MYQVFKVVLWSTPREMFIDEMIEISYDLLM